MMCTVRYSIYHTCIVGSFLQIIYIDKSIVIAKFFKSSKLSINSTNYHRHIFKTQSYIPNSKTTSLNINCLDTSKF